MNRLLGILFYAVISLSFCSNAFGWERYTIPPIVYTGPATFNAYPCYTYSVTVDVSTITVEWDAMFNVLHYEVRLHNVERNIRTNLGIVQDHEITFKLPDKTGHYIVESRSIRYFDEATKSSIRTKTRTQLLEFIESMQVDVDIIPGMLDTQLAEAIIVQGSTSAWSVTSDPANALVNNIKKCWWIVGKPASPGAIIITK